MRVNIPLVQPEARPAFATRSSRHDRRATTPYLALQRLSAHAVYRSGQYLYLLHTEAALTASVWHLNGPSQARSKPAQPSPTRLNSTRPISTQEFS